MLWYMIYLLWYILTPIRARHILTMSPSTPTWIYVSLFQSGFLFGGGGVCVCVCVCVGGGGGGGGGRGERRGGARGILETRMFPSTKNEKSCGVGLSIYMLDRVSSRLSGTRAS